MSPIFYKLKVWSMIPLLSFSLSFSAELSGTIRYEGQAIPLKTLTMEKDPTCHGLHKTPIKAENLILGKKGALGNVIIKIVSGLPNVKYAPPQSPALISQRGCKYSPHVSVVQKGQRVHFLNPNKTSHNIHSKSRVNRAFNTIMPKYKKKYDMSFKKVEEPFELKCDVHPWMNAWVTVTDHPFFAVSSSNGQFTIKGIPAGTYEVEAWHEMFGKKTATIKLVGPDSKTLDFTFAK